jgi:IclR family acetate operon transcriptional repressor
MDDQALPISQQEKAREVDLRVPSKDVLRASGQVQSLSRSLRLMNALAFHPQGITLSEVAQKVGLPTSTAHRLLTTLQNERFVRFDNERSVWQVGVQAFRVGSAFTRGRDLAAIARPFMRRLVEQSGETVNLAIPDRQEVIYLAQVECQKMMRAIAGPGGRSSYHASAVGKAIMAAMSEPELSRLISQLDLRPETPHSITSPEMLKKELAATAQRGYAVDDEENAVGLRCVAGGIYDEHGAPLAALSVSGPAARITEARLASLGAGVAAVADEITAELGGRKPGRRH